MYIILPDCISKDKPYLMVGKIPYHKVPYTDEYHINPTDVAASALRGCSECLDWLLTYQQADGGYYHFYHDIYYNQEPGWTSAVTQAIAAMVLSNSGHFDEARKALYFMLSHHLSRKMNAINEKGNTLILNGWLYGLYALWYCSANDKQLKCEDFFDKSIGYLIERMPDFMMKNGWTRYDESGIPATPFYHGVHIELYNTLKQITGRLPNIEFGDRYPKVTRLYYIVKKNNIYTLPIYMKVRKW